jgi:hypothetical protein
MAASRVNGSAEVAKLAEPSAQRRSYRSLDPPSALLTPNGG